MLYDWIGKAFEQIDKANPYHSSATGEFCSPKVDPDCNLHVSDGVLSGVAGDGSLYQLSAEELTNLANTGPRRIQQLARDMLMQATPDAEGQQEFPFMEGMERPPSVPAGFSWLSDEKAAEVVAAVENAVETTLTAGYYDSELYHISSNVHLTASIDTEFYDDLTEEELESMGRDPDDFMSFDDMLDYEGGVPPEEEIFEYNREKLDFPTIWLIRSLAMGNIGVSNQRARELRWGPLRWMQNHELFRTFQTKLLKAKDGAEAASLTSSYSKVKNTRHGYSTDISKVTKDLYDWARLGGDNYEGEMYRGLSGNYAKELANSPIGSTHEEPCFASWSSNDKLSKQWTGNKREFGVLLRYKAKKGDPTLPVVNFGNYPAESEVLFASPVRFKVTNKSHEGAKVILDVEIEQLIDLDFSTP